MIFTVISSDKLSLSMFIDFLMSTVYREFVINILDLNCLYSDDIQEAKLQNMMPADDDHVLLIKYKTKPQTKLPEGICQKVLDSSSYVVAFDLWSTHPKMLKAIDEAYLEPFLRTWESTVERMNKL